MSVTELDITTEHCPMTFVKTKFALSKLGDGDILEVFLTAGEPLDNVPRAAREQGFQVRKIEQIDADIYKVVIQK